MNRFAALSPRGARLAALALLAALAAVSLSGCGGDDIAASRGRLMARAARHVQRTLSDAITRARKALAAVDRELPSAGSDRALQFDRLEEVRSRTHVTGIAWEGSGSANAWAGTPVEAEAHELPAPPPWDGSFQSGDVRYHAGPFLRAIVVSKALAAGGSESATVVLVEPGAAPFEGSLEESWAARERVKSVRVRSPAAPAGPPSASMLRVGVRGEGDAKDVLEVEVEAPGDEAIGERLAENGRRFTGLLLLAGLAIGIAAAVAAGRRWISSPLVRAAGLLIAALGARAALAALALPERYRELAPAFRTIDFGVTGWSGWLATPGDFALSSAAFLIGAAAVARALSTLASPARISARAAAAAAGGCVAVLATALWLALVEAAALNGRIDYFAPGTLFPAEAHTLMISALAAATAGAWLLARAGIALARRAAPDLPQRFARLSFGLLAGAAVGAIAGQVAPGSFPVWAPFLVPLSAALLLGVGTREGPAGAPSRIVLVSVLSALLLFPVLWVGVQGAARSDARDQVEVLARREGQIASELPSWLAPLKDDAHLVASLEAVAARKPAPEGLAIYAWLRMPLGRGGDDGAVVVLDRDGKRIDRFGLDTPPFDLLPSPSAQDAAKTDVTVETGVETPGHLRTTIGRARIRSRDGRAVGTVVVLIPDPLLLALSGRRERIAATESGAARTAPRFPMSLVSNGRVTATNDPGARRSKPPVAFDPAAVVEPAWLDAKGDDGAEWLAVPAGARGVLLAKREAAGPSTVVFAMARLAMVAVGLGGVLALLALAAGVRKLTPRLQGRILTSYFAISVLPVVILGYADWRETRARGEEDFRARQEAFVRAAQLDIQSLSSLLYTTKEVNASGYAQSHDFDLSVYLHGSVDTSSLKVLMDAELLPSRLPGQAYRATELEGRELYRSEEDFAGGVVRVGYAPIRDESGAPIATVAVPLRYDPARAEEEAARAGSMLLAAYLLILVLIVVIGIYTARSLARPLDLLAQGAKRVGAGETDLVIPGGGTDEIGSLVDAFNRMTTELKEVRARAASAEREAAWRGMARQVAHEIKNPLTPMKLMLQQLVATAKTDPAYAARTLEPTAKIVLEQIDALSRIASDFSAFARFPPRNVAEQDVNEILRAVAALYAAGEGSTATLETRLSEGLPAVRWDRDELRRVFVNLVANAVQAVDERKGRVRIAVRSERAKVPQTGREGVLVTVEDDGVGIPLENRARLFEPDFSTKSAGTGLGLAIVKRVLADLGGEISIESEPGKGTSVRVWMPGVTA